MTPASLLGLHADVVAIASAPFAAMGRRHGAATGGAAQQAAQESAGGAAAAVVHGWPIRLQECLDLLPNIGSDDGRVISLVDFLSVTELAAIDDVGEQLVQGVLGEGAAAAGPAFPCQPLFGEPAPAKELGDDGVQASIFQVECKN